MDDKLDKPVEVTEVPIPANPSGAEGLAKHFKSIINLYNYVSLFLLGDFLHLLFIALCDCCFLLLDLPMAINSTPAKKLVHYDWINWRITIGSIIPYSPNLSRVKTFADFASFSKSVKVFTSKHFLQNNYFYVALCKYFSLKIMSLLKYFKRESQAILPHPNGPLSQSVPSSSIAARLKIKQWRVFCLPDQ